MRTMRSIVSLMACTLMMCAMLGFARAESAIPPAPTQWVTDKSGLLSTQKANDLNARLRAYEQQTGHQVLVYIAPTTGGIPIEDWAVRAFAQWKVGRKGLDDGLILFIFTSDKTLRIEVGYGLESKVPDALAARIIRETIVPKLRAGQGDLAVTSGIDRVLGLLDGESTARSGNAKEQPTNDELSSFFAWIFGIFIVLRFFPWLLPFWLINISGRHGGDNGKNSDGFFGGSGFSGGGGRSGGGGASGSW